MTEFSFQGITCVHLGWRALDPGLLSHVTQPCLKNTNSELPKLLFSFSVAIPFCKAFAVRTPLNGTMQFGRCSNNAGLSLTFIMACLLHRPEHQGKEQLVSCEVTLLEIKRRAARWGTPALQAGGSYTTQETPCQLLDPMSPTCLYLLMSLLQRNQSPRPPCNGSVNCY